MEESVKKETARAFEDAFISRKELVGLDAYLFAWEILNDYPEELQDIALEWLKTGKTPETEVNRLSVEMIQDATGKGFVTSLRILRHYLHDPSEAASLITAYARRNGRN